MFNFTFLDYLVYILASYSLTFGFIESPLFDGIRRKITIKKNSKLKYLCHCYHCSGFWLSLFLAFVIFDIPLISYFILALSSSIAVFYLDRIVTYIESRIVTLDLDRNEVIRLRENKD